MDRLRARPLATVLAVISALLIVLGRINRDVSWGTPIFVGGVVLLVGAGMLVYVRRG